MTPFYICIVSRAIRRKSYYSTYLHQDGGTSEQNSSQHWDSFLTFMNGQRTWESDRNSFSRTMFKEQTGHIHSSLISSLSTALQLKAGDLKVYRNHLLCHGLHLESVLCCQQHKALNPADNIRMLLKYVHGETQNHWIYCYILVNILTLGVRNLVNLVWGEVMSNVSNCLS